MIVTTLFGVFVANSNQVLSTFGVLLLLYMNIQKQKKNNSVTSQSLTVRIVIALVAKKKKKKKRLSLWSIVSSEVYEAKNQHFPCLKVTLIC